MLLLVKHTATIVLSLFISALLYCYYVVLTNINIVHGCCFLIFKILFLHVLKRKLLFPEHQISWVSD